MSKSIHTTITEYLAVNRDDVNASATTSGILAALDAEGFEIVEAGRAVQPPVAEETVQALRESTAVLRVVLDELDRRDHTSTMTVPVELLRGLMRRALHEASLSTLGAHDDLAGRL